MTHEARLAELGIALPPVTAPAFDYVPAVVHGGLVWISGQLPRAADGSLPHLGRLGEEVDVETARKAAELCALQALAALRAATAAAGKSAAPTRQEGGTHSGPREKERRNRERQSRSGGRSEGEEGRSKRGATKRKERRKQKGEGEEKGQELKDTAQHKGQELKNIAH